VTAEILVAWVVFADVTLEFCMDLVTSYVTCLRHSLMLVLGTVCTWCCFLHFLAAFVTATVQCCRRCCKMVDCGMIDGTVRNYVVQLGAPICQTAAP
jgi:hypothetical protein